jgi:hypothetical protein
MALVTATVMCIIAVWLLAISLVMSDTTIPPTSKRRWIVALVLLNLIAGITFVLWGYPRISRQGDRT